MSSPENSQFNESRKPPTANVADTIDEPPLRVSGGRRLQGGAKFIDHNNVIQAVRRIGDFKLFKFASEAREVMFRGTISPEAVTIIKKGDR